MPDEAAETPIRRPRMTPAREMELLEAAMDVLREVGYEELSMDLVASRGRCSKATLYRLWPTKPDLVAAALYATRPVRPQEIDTGSLRSDLLTLITVLGANAEQHTALFAGMAHAMLTDADLHAAVHTTVVKPWFVELDGFIDRAVERGELTVRPPAAELLPELLLSAAFMRPLFGGGLADVDYLTRCLDLVLLPAVSPEAPNP